MKIAARLMATTMLAGMIAAPVSAAEMIVGLITKTDTNPFFVKMKEGAQEKAAELGVEGADGLEHGVVVVDVQRRDRDADLRMAPGELVAQLLQPLGAPRA